MAILGDLPRRRWGARRAGGQRGWLALGLALCALMFAAPAGGAPSMEYQVKAVLLFNFASFVEWPVPARTDSPGPFVIGVLGDDPFGAALDDVVSQETVAGRSLTVRRFGQADGVDACDILFISRSEARHVPEILRQVQGRPILTVADIPSFAETGGIIGFSTQDGHVRLNINTEAAQSAGLAISSKLLRLARVVTPQ